MNRYTTSNFAKKDSKKDSANNSAYRSRQVKDRDYNIQTYIYTNSIIKYREREGLSFSYKTDIVRKNEELTVSSRNL